MMPGVSRVPAGDLGSLEIMSSAEQEQRWAKSRASNSNSSNFQISGLLAQQATHCNGILSKSYLEK